MISICIPIFNCDARRLVQDLHVQAIDLNISFEIILLDDGSSSAFKTLNNELNQLTGVSYHENVHNLGVSQTRNRLSQLAINPYLLYIDSDAQIDNPDYLKNYLKYCSLKVVCFGGCKYNDLPPSEEYMLRWKFGKKREEGVGVYYSCFNLLIDADIVRKHPFLDELNLYGYEDNLFGIVLEHNNYNLLHINNPLLHPCADTSERYLAKIDQSLHNLLIIRKYLIEHNLPNTIKLLKVYLILEKLHLIKLISLVFDVSKKRCVDNLTSSKPSLLILDFYKIGYLCSLQKKLIL